MKSYSLDNFEIPKWPSKLRLIHRLDLLVVCLGSNERMKWKKGEERLRTRFLDKIEIKARAMECHYVIFCLGGKTAHTFAIDRSVEEMIEMKDNGFL